MTIDQAIMVTLAEWKVRMRDYLTQWPFHREDMNNLITARKERIWIKEPPKSRCTKQCLLDRLRVSGTHLEIEGTTV